MQAGAPFHIRVVDPRGRPITKAKFSWCHSGTRKFRKISSKYSGENGLYFLFPDFPFPAKGELRTYATGLAYNKRKLNISREGCLDTVVLARKDEPFILRGGIQVPVHREPSKVALFLRQLPKGKQRKSLDRLLKQEELSPINTDEAESFPLEFIFTRKTVRDAKLLVRQLQYIVRDRKEKSIGEIILGGVCVGSAEVMWPTRRVTVKLKSPDDFEALQKYIAKRSAKTLGRELLFPEFVTLEYTGKTLSRIFRFISELSEKSWVENCEVNYLTYETLHAAVRPGDIIRPTQWHLETLQVPKAWEALKGNHPDLTFGSADIIFAVHDEGIETSGGGTVIHPDLSGVVAGGNLSGFLGGVNKKVYYQYQFSHSFTDHDGDPATRKIPTAVKLMTINNDSRSKNHGIWVAGIAAAGTDGVTGVVGVAPNVRIASYIWTTTFADIWRYEIKFMSGLNPGWKKDSIDYHSTQLFPPPFHTRDNPGPGASIINFSHSHSGVPTSLEPEAYQAITLFGRGRRGTVGFTSSGNGDRNTRIKNKWGNEFNIIKVSASTFDHTGDKDHKGKEIPAAYADFSTAIDPLIDFAAPSHSNQAMINDPPNLYALVTNHKVSSGDVPGTRNKFAVIQNTPPPGGKEIELLPADLPNFPVNKEVIIRDPTNHEHTEFATVHGVAGNKIELARKLLHGYPNGEIITGDFDYTQGFGGTSGACPQASGIAALVLTANPKLTWAEVREIMRQTAVPIAPHHVGQNRDRRWVEIGPGGTTDDLVDPNGVLDLQGPSTVTASALKQGKGEIDVLSTVGFERRQAILIGAETKLALEGNPPTNQIKIVRASELEIGDKIFIGKPAETILERDIVINSPFIFVQNPDGFEGGDIIDVGGDSAKIDSIVHINGGTSNDARIKFNITPQNALGTFPIKTQGTKVHIGAKHREGPFTISNKVGNTLTLNSPLTKIHPKDRIVQKENTETRVVLEIISLTKLKIDPLENDHPLGSIVHVTGGRIASYNFALGFGRLDAEEAVKQAIAYNHTERDLMIRNFVGDDGETNVAAQPVQSPDLWATNINPAFAGLNYGDEPPHENPRLDISAPVFAGPGLNDLSVDGAYTGAGQGIYTVEISATGTPDTFTWVKDGGAQSAPQNIVPGPIAIAEGMTINFGVTTGHTIGNKWRIRVEAVATRHVHLRIKNRGTGPTIAQSAVANALPIAVHRIILCLSDGTPVQKFYGSGINDLEVLTSFTGGAKDFFTIKIDSTGAADKFVWAKGTGGFSAAVAMTGGPQNLSDGVSIQFGVITGHTKDDIWVLKAYPEDEKWVTVDHFVERTEPTIYNPAAPGVPTTYSLETNKAGAWLISSDANNPYGKEIATLNGLAEEIYHEPWPLDKSPPRNGPGMVAKPLKLFLLGEILPHDGLLDGYTAKENNNFSYRELIFARFDYRDGLGHNEIKNFFEVDSFGTVLAEDFQIQVLADVGSFQADSVKIEVEIKSVNGTTETKIFEHDGANWTFTGGAPPWLNLSPPKNLVDQSVAIFDQEYFQLGFSGTLNLSRNHERVTITPKIYSALQTGLVLAEETKSIPVFEQALLPSARFAGVAPADLAPRSHFFTETSVTQDQTQAYGPVDGDEANKYRVTSLFKHPTKDPRAFAVVNGIVMVQREAGNNNVVNLILKPYKQPMLGFTPVRYFIYRGIKLKDILKDETPANEKLVRDQAGASEWIDKLWQIHIDQNDTGTPFETKALGYDPDIQTGADLLDKYFYRSDPAFQLPFVEKGQHMGDFFADGGSAEFGFEIVLEEGDFQLDLDYVRKSKHEVDVSGMASGTPTEKLNLRLKREEILRYIDPAAFFGMHNSDGGNLEIDDGAGTKDKLTGADIYDQVIKKFHTKNALYVDIRNENGLSYNFYNKYDLGSGNSLALGNAPGSIADHPYATHSWPILILSGPGIINANDFNEVHLRLRKDYNHKPILYIEHGRPLSATTKGKFMAGGELYPVAGDDTNVIGFRFPNQDDGSGNKVANAWLIKLHYGLEIDPANLAFPVEVPETTSYLDNLFGPLSWKPGNQGNPV